MSYLVTWGVEHQENRVETDLDTAVSIAHANDGIIFSDGQQLSPSDIESLLHPFRTTAEEIVNKLLTGLRGESGRCLEIQADVPTNALFSERVGTWTRDSAITAVERVLEGSGLA